MAALVKPGVFKREKKRGKKPKPRANSRQAVHCTNPSGLKESCAPWFMLSWLLHPAAAVSGSHPLVTGCRLCRCWHRSLQRFRILLLLRALALPLAFFSLLLLCLFCSFTRLEPGGFDSDALPVEVSGFWWLANTGCSGTEDVSNQSYPVWLSRKSHPSPCSPQPLSSKIEIYQSCWEQEISSFTACSPLLLIHLIVLTLSRK